MVDIARDSSVRRRKRVRHALIGAACVVLVVLASLAVARMAPAAPQVDRRTVVIDTVRRGPFIREVRGIGTLVPEDTRWLPATTEGRVEHIRLRPGAAVAPDTVIVELSNPQVEQEALTAGLALRSARAELENLRVQLQNDLLTQEAAVASVEAEYRQAQLEAEANDALAEQQLQSAILVKQSHLRAEVLRTQYEIEKKRLAIAGDSIETRMQVQQAAVEQAQALADLQQRRLAALNVRAGFSGVLQQVPVEVGQSVAPGQNLARVADPGRLKAELRISETLARDVEIGQAARVDTRNAIIAGRVSRKDPAATDGAVVVDVSLDGQLPRGAVPDLTVDGIIELERLETALQVGRPANAQENSTLSLFRLDGASGEARRVQARVGRSAAETIQVMSGLSEGEQVIVSDMSGWDSFDRVVVR